MLTGLEAILAFLAANADVIRAVESALSAGTEKEAIMAAVKAAEIAASNRAMKAELGLPQLP